MKNTNGSALLVVLMVLVVLGLLGAATLTFSGQGLSLARNRETAVGLSNCAMAVRQYLASNVRAGATLSSLDFTIPGSSSPIRIQGGHFDNIDGGTFPILPAAPVFGATIGGTSVENIANALPMGIGAGGTIRTGTAVCRMCIDNSDNSTCRDYEVEFSFVG